MYQILVVNSSVSGDASVSRALVNHAVQCLMKADPESVVVQRDLSHAPVPDERMPKSVLLVDQSGTCKTLLAMTMASEASTHHRRS